MGYYINPPDCSKETWLDRHATQVASRDDAEEERADGFIPICLVDNGPFTAAGIGYDQRESEAFNEPRTGRPKKWYVAPREDVIAICPQVASVLEQVT